MSYGKSRDGIFLEEVDSDAVVSVVYWASIGKIKLNFRHYKFKRIFNGEKQELVFRVQALRPEEKLHKSKSLLKK